MAIHMKYLNCTKYEIFKYLNCTTDVSHGFANLKCYANILFVGFTTLVLLNYMLARLSGFVVYSVLMQNSLTWDQIKSRSGIYVCVHVC